MEDTLKRKQQLESATKEYLSHVKMLRLSDAVKLVNSGDCVWIFGITPVYEQDDPDAYYPLAPAATEQNFLDRIDGLFDSQIKASTVRSTIHIATFLTSPDSQFKFPFETDKREQLYHDKIYDLLSPHHEYRCDALVPVYQLECASEVEFPLANAVLHSGGSQSLLAETLNNDAATLFEDDKRRIENCSFLRFPVTGDSPSRLEQIEYEAERALQVLRFIYPWFEKEGKAYNPAHGVTTLKQSRHVIVYHRTSETGDWSPWHSAIPNGIYGTQRINAQFLKYARKVRGLDDINWHFKKHDLNPVSRRFCRAFKYYDIASQTSDADVALTNFTICVDMLLPKGKARELTEYLISLIVNGDLYEGKMTLNDQFLDPEKTGWPERIRLTVRDYKEYYIIRNKVVHGNTMSDIVSDMHVKKSRQIASNAIRAYAKLSRAFNWQCDKEAKNWFKSPCKPPK